MDLYITSCTLPQTDKSERLWRVTPIIIEFQLIGASEDEVSRMHDRMIDALQDMNKYDANDLLRFLKAPMI